MNELNSQAHWQWHKHGMHTHTSINNQTHMTIMQTKLKQTQIHTHIHTRTHIKNCINEKQTKKALIYKE